MRVASRRFHIKLSAYHPVLLDTEITHMYISMPVCAHTHMHYCTHMNTHTHSTVSNLEHVEAWEAVALLPPPAMVPSSDTW